MPAAPRAHPELVGSPRAVWRRVLHLHPLAAPLAGDREVDSRHPRILARLPGSWSQSTGVQCPGGGRRHPHRRGVVPHGPRQGSAAAAGWRHVPVEADTVAPRGRLRRGRGGGRRRRAGVPAPGGTGAPPGPTRAESRPVARPALVASRGPGRSYPARAARDRDGAGRSPARRADDGSSGDRGVDTFRGDRGAPVAARPPRPPGAVRRACACGIACGGAVRRARESSSARTPPSRSTWRWTTRVRSRTSTRPRTIDGSSGSVSAPSDGRSEDGRRTRPWPLRGRCGRFRSLAAAFLAFSACLRLSDVCAPNFFVNRSTRPSVSISFWRPVKNGWHCEQISRRSSSLVDRVFQVAPQAHRTSTSLYFGWIPCFTVDSFETGRNH